MRSAVPDNMLAAINSACMHAGAGLVGTLPPVYESLPDLTLLFVANNPGSL